MTYRLMPGTRAPVKIWTDPQTIEPEAARQLRNIGALPWVEGVAVMPDVHFGKGATVGSVIAMRQALAPAAVGVDIGCFTGDTKVLLADSKAYRLDELVDRAEPFAIYSCTSDGLIRAAKATARKTRENAPLVGVELDNGEIVRCTPDHEFMLRSGGYARADSLAPGTSLMPMYGKLDPEGYFRVQQPHSGAWQRAHWVVARSGLLGDVPSFKPQRTVIHHKNFDEADNRPENLMFMSADEHSRFHRSLVERNTHWHSESFEAARVAALAAKAKTPERYAEYAGRGTKNIVTYMSTRRSEFLHAVSGNGKRGKKYLIAYNQSDKGRAVGSGTGAVACAGGRAASLHSCGFPQGRPTCVP